MRVNLAGRLLSFRRYQLFGPLAHQIIVVIGKLHLLSSKVSNPARASDAAGQNKEEN
jgi:hypothetical protein